MKTAIAGCAVALLLAACSDEPVEIAKEQVVTPAYAHENQATGDLAVRNFAITPPTVRRGQPVTASVDVDHPAPNQSLTLAWYGPDGWLIRDEAKPAQRGTLQFQAPAQSFETPGVYRAELRTTETTAPLASGAVTVTD